MGIQCFGGVALALADGKLVVAWPLVHHKLTSFPCSFLFLWLVLLKGTRCMQMPLLTRSHDGAV